MRGVDRGYARAVRGRRATVVYHNDKRVRLDSLKSKQGQAKRCHGVLCHSKQQVPLDVVVYREKGFREPWYLLIPPGSEAILETEQVVDLYRQRIKIERAFRDFKTHLGLRGLKLKVRISERMGRLILAFLIAYCLALLLGVSQEAVDARHDLEVPRATPRHGTCRTLSAFFVASQMLSHPKHKGCALKRLKLIAGTISNGLPALPVESAIHVAAA